jgi:hypothetical protein
MSLTILIHDKLPVAIVRWFLEPKGLVLFAGGPVVQMPLEEFRAMGCDWIRRHFEEYARIRVPEDKIVKVFQPGEAAKFMKGRRVLEIHIDPQKNLIFSPMVVDKYNLGDLKRVKPLVEQSIPLSRSREVFWKTFDEALAVAPCAA